MPTFGKDKGIRYAPTIALEKLPPRTLASATAPLAAWAICGIRLAISALTVLCMPVVTFMVWLTTTPEPPPILLLAMIEPD